MVTLPAAAEDDVRPPTPALAMSGVTKSYGPSLVLNGVDFAVNPGEVHALMGENGAGKSTLMKIAAGLVDDYAGELRVGGAPVRFSSPREAARAGIAIIHQELSLVPALAVDENIFLGQEKLRTLCVVDRKKQIQAARATLDLLSFQARVEDPVGRLRVGEQQLVEIAKALVAQARVLIMDEPTSALSVHESERLFSVIRRLARDGVAIVYISHRMEEVFALSARLTVLRDGRRIGTVPTRQTARGEVIRMMVGRELAEAGDPATATPAAAAAPAPPPRLEVRGLWLDHPAPTPSRPRLLAQVSFAVRPGEVFGVAGLLGAGRTELLEALFGLHPLSSGGEVRLDGRPVRLTNPAQAKAAGLAFVTEDRKRDGLILDFSITQVVGLPMQERLARFGFVRRVQEVALARRTIAELGVAARGPAQPVGTLSGGNQQKVVIGKWLQTGPRVLLLDEPTRGIDVGAKAEIYRLVGELTGRGLAIVLVSSELPELVRLSHRILVLREGRPTALFERGAFDQETLLEHASPGGPVQPAFAGAAAATPGADADAATAPAPAPPLP